jgi:HK97 family phage portal protein
MSFTRDLFNKAQPQLVQTNSVTKSLKNVLGFRSSPVQQMQSMGNVGTLFAIVTRLANATSQVEWKLYRTQDGRGRISGEETRKEVTTHAALDLWNKPNNFYTRQEFVETFQQHQELVGESVWVLLRDPRLEFPVEMWPVRPDKIVVNPSKTEFIKDYTYCGPDGEKIPLEKDEVIQLKLPNPLDPYRGMGPVQSILADLDGVKYSAEWNRNFFLNSAEPGGIIQVDKRLSDDEFDEMTKRWNEQHKGVHKAHRVAVIEQGQWVDRSFSQRDMQFVQLREVSRDTIMEAFSINKMMMGIVDDVNRASAIASEYVFAKYHMVSRLERIKQALNTKLLPLFGSTSQGLEFDYCSPVPKDEEAEASKLQSSVDAAVKLIGAGFDPEEVLSSLELPALTYVGRGNAEA